jgi:hypothetical protein
MEVLAAVDTTWQRDFGGMRVLKGHKGGKIQRIEAQALKVEENSFGG